MAIREPLGRGGAAAAGIVESHRVAVLTILMSARPPIDLPPVTGLQVLPDEEHARLALREARVLMAPVVRWLLRHGVHYGPFADVLKGVFVAVAREELSQAQAKTTDSAISVMSGVHRKDVRAIGADPNALPLPRCVPMAAQLLARWRADARFLDCGGAPKALPRSGASGSFEALAREISSDVHPRTLLDELLRLGQVALDAEIVRIARPAVRPAPGIEDGAVEFSTSAADHIAAAVHNLTLGGPKFLEQSLAVDGLSSDSAQQLHEAARAAWQGMFENLVANAREQIRTSSPAEGDARVRFGVYYYSEPSSTPADGV